MSAEGVSAVSPVHWRARVFGDHINTDYIIASRRKRDAADIASLLPYVFEAIAPEFARSVEASDVVVGGVNFGCGSAMEVAAEVLKAIGLRAVVARSFSRAFYRNAVNVGLPLLTIPVLEAQEGDVLVCEGVDSAAPSLRNDRTGELYQALATSDIVRGIVAAGGLIPFVNSLKCRDDERSAR